ncbi:MAG: FAD-binding oxidoreductase [Deltaproteobacteria bacterium]|nr:FAD-binding oxidoreductase [Deltaproteobacteria bacterium]MBT4525264.1 FAD-binding oxidoreductase [Deltaproteobacteria bacterium]
MTKKQHSEVIIMGGGVIGVTCAYYLLKAGRKVRIIEQNEIGSGASHGNYSLQVFNAQCFQKIVRTVISRRKAQLRLGIKWHTHFI